MIFYPREHQDEDCGCAWRTEPIDRLCDRCRRMREDEQAAQEAKEAYADED